MMTEPYREQLLELLRSLARPSSLLGLHSAARAAVAAVGSLNQDGPPILRPEAALAAVRKFFEERQMLSRDEFHRILRRSQG
jgi:hypothetical protein